MREPRKVGKTKSMANAEIAKAVGGQLFQNQSCDNAVDGENDRDAEYDVGNKNRVDSSGFMSKGDDVDSNDDMDTIDDMENGDDTDNDDDANETNINGGESENDSDKVHDTGSDEDATSIESDREANKPGSAIKYGKKRSTIEKRRVPLYTEQRAQNSPDSVERAKIIAVVDDFKRLLSKPTPISIGYVDFHNNEDVFALETNQRINLQRVAEFSKNWLQYIEDKANSTEQRRALKQKTNILEQKSSQAEVKNGRAIGNKRSANIKTNKQPYKERVAKSAYERGEGSNETGRVGNTGLRPQSDCRNSPQHPLDLTGLPSRASTISVSSSYTTTRQSPASAPSPTPSIPESSSDRGLVLQHSTSLNPSQIMSENPSQHLQNSSSTSAKDPNANGYSPRLRPENNGKTLTTMSHGINESPPSASEVALDTNPNSTTHKSIIFSTFTNQDKGASQAPTTPIEESRSHLQPTIEPDNQYEETRGSTSQSSNRAPANESAANKHNGNFNDHDQEMDDDSSDDSASQCSSRHAALNSRTNQLISTSGASRLGRMESLGIGLNTLAADISRKRKASSPHAITPIRPAPALSSVFNPEPIHCETSPHYQNRSRQSMHNVWCYLARASVEDVQPPFMLRDIEKQPLLIFNDPRRLMLNDSSLEPVALNPPSSGTMHAIWRPRYDYLLQLDRRSDEDTVRALLMCTALYEFMEHTFPRTGTGRIPPINKQMLRQCQDLFYGGDGDEAAEDLRSRASSFSSGLRREDGSVGSPVRTQQPIGPPTPTTTPRKERTLRNLLPNGFSPAHQRAQRTADGVAISPLLSPKELEKNLKEWRRVGSQVQAVMKVLGPGIVLYLPSLGVSWALLKRNVFLDEALLEDIVHKIDVQTMAQRAVSVGPLPSESGPWENGVGMGTRGEQIALTSTEAHERMQRAGAVGRDVRAALERLEREGFLDGVRASGADKIVSEVLEVLRRPWAEIAGV